MIKSILKPITIDHSALLLKWRNSHDVRVMMINSDVITEDNHKEWFENMLNSQLLKFYIYYVNNCPSGVMNYKIDSSDDKIATWGFYLGVKGLPPGHGTDLCKKGVIQARVLNLKKIKASVLTKNTKSKKIHEKLGFTQYKIDNDSVYYSKDLTIERL